MKNQTLEELTRSTIKKFNIRISKKFGQNFLIDEKALDNILYAAQINKDDYVLEIGPGLGILTKLLCDNAKHVLAVEIDKHLVDILRINLSDYSNLGLLNEDILKLDIKKELKKSFKEKKCKVVANLPYYITSPIIMRLIEERQNINSMTLMVQKEVAQRIAAGPGGKQFGILSVAVQYYSIPEIIAEVPAQSFYPRPEVDSAIIKLTLRQKPFISVEDEAFFFRVVRGAFSQRRKTLLNSLYGSDLRLEKNDLEKILINCEIDSRRRAETLSLEEFALISKEIELYIKKQSTSNLP
ncbi:MAG: 16S rRNA (adenine(1518)-N(6)/adenine(1519)-N(6))-dimethyltransferase RsmA [Firmicutes bacterium]|nr:16S rRNA (adenine(1518)-N(6)/adenine(1519)-N(6))-dimethyltransferase RsmA [Bacillota bacterium]